MLFLVTYEPVVLYSNSMKKVSQFKVLWLYALTHGRLLVSSYKCFRAKPYKISRASYRRESLATTWHRYLMAPPAPEVAMENSQLDSISFGNVMLPLQAVTTPIHRVVGLYRNHRAMGRPFSTDERLLARPDSYMGHLQQSSAFLGESASVHCFNALRTLSGSSYATLSVTKKTF